MQINNNPHFAPPQQLCVGGWILENILNVVRFCGRICVINSREETDGRVLLGFGGRTIVSGTATITAPDPNGCVDFL